MARELWERRQKVIDFLYLHVPFTDDPKSCCLYLKVKILGLYECVSFVSRCLENLIQADEDALDYLVRVLVLNE